MNTTNKYTSSSVWAAPAALANLQQRGGASSWSVIHSKKSPARFIAVALNHEPDEFRLAPSGRTPGRALRAMRRWLKRENLPFGEELT